jgi:hypothetical protein
MATVTYPQYGRPTTFFRAATPGMADSMTVCQSVTAFWEKDPDAGTTLSANPAAKSTRFILWILFIVGVSFYILHRSYFLHRSGPREDSTLTAASRG